MSDQANHHLSFPHLRLSKKKFLVFEKGQIYYTKLQSGSPIYTPIIHRSEICKIEAQYYYSYRAPYNLRIRIIPRVGMEKIYAVSPKKFGYPYTQEQRTQISDFFLALDFHPSPVGKNLRDVHNSTRIKDIYRYFPVGDRIFDLCEDPEFKQKLESLKPPFLPWFLLRSGLIGWVISIALCLIYPSTGAFWISGLASLACLGYRIPKLRQYRKKESDFSQKYDLLCYFK